MGSVQRVVDVQGLWCKSCGTLAIPWTVACQAPPSMGFSRQEYWSGLPFPSPGDLPDLSPVLLSCLASVAQLFVTPHTVVWQAPLSMGFSQQEYWSGVQSLSRVRLLATLWTVACQAPLSMGFSQQEYWSGLPCPH